jgi:hypothetical protein
MRLPAAHYVALSMVLQVLFIGQGGCNSPSKTEDVQVSERAKRVLRMKPDPNIIEVGHFYTPFRHWIWTEDQARVQGTWISSLYLYGNTQKGVFGDGIIRPRVYLLERNERGGMEPRLIKEWAFDVEAAMPFRSMTASVQGYGYRLPLVWGDLDLTGKEIRVIVVFERRDGRPVPSSKMDLMPVPGPKSQR